MYLDNDVHCLQLLDPTLKGLSLALQAEVPDGSSLTNAVMASSPGHALWPALLAHMAEQQEAVQDVRLTDGNLILASTGPYALTAVFAALFGLSQRSLPGRYSSAEGPAAVFGLGHWLQPCACKDPGCHAAVRAGQLAPVRPGSGTAGGGSDIVGHHLCEATWWKAHKRRNRLRKLGRVGGAGAGLAAAAAAGLCMVWRLRRRTRAWFDLG